MAAGILFMYEDRILPTVAEKRAELEATIKPRIRALMDADPFTDEQMERYRNLTELKRRYLFAREVLAEPSLRAKFDADKLQAMESLVSTIHADPDAVNRLRHLERIGHRIERFESCYRYLNRGVGAMNDTQLGNYLQMKQRQSYRRHDPVDAFTEEKIGADCPNPKFYSILFDGLTLEEAKGFCTQQPGNPKTALKRQYRFRYALIPQAAKNAIEADQVPRINWNPVYMELKGG